MDYVSPVWIQSLPSLCLYIAGRPLSVEMYHSGVLLKRGENCGDNVYYWYVICIPLWIMYPQFKPNPFYHYVSTSWSIYWVWKCITVAYCWHGWKIVAVGNVSCNISASSVSHYGLRIPSLNPKSSTFTIYDGVFKLSLLGVFPYLLVCHRVRALTSVVS